MRTIVNTLNPLMFFWSIVYVLALLSIYTVIAGILARSRDGNQVPRKTNQKLPRFRPLSNQQASNPQNQ